MVITDLAVYRDPDFPSSWIDDKAGYPDKIATFLSGKGLRQLNSDQLRQFMVEGIKKRIATDKLVLFSQDIIPDTVTEDYFANTTIREYLDNGGSVLWIGDIPAFNIGKKGRQLDEAWKKGSPLFMLGVCPIFTESPKQAVTFTIEGRMLGLKERWSGRRPILKDLSIKILADSESYISQYYIDIPKPRVLSLRQRFTSRLKGIKAEGGVGPIKGSLGLEFYRPQEQPSEEKKDKMVPRVFHERNINAWMKNYNKTYPNSGLYRIWDYGPRHLTDAMLAELYDVVRSISKK